jgi:hypothetical protein
MKMNQIAALVVALLAVAETSHAQQAPPTGPIIITSAGNNPGRLMVEGIAQPKVSANENVVVSITPLLMPMLNTADGITAGNAIIAAALAGTLNYNTGPITGPTQFTVSGYKVDWTNIVYSTTVSMWGGMLNPPFPSFGGPLQTLLIEGWAPLGDLSMDQLTISATSSDGNILAGTVGFVNTSYTSDAVCVRLDGTIITNGASSQQGKHILVLVQLPLFNGGGTQTGLDDVHNWWNLHQPYILGYTAGVIGNSASQTSATVTSQPDVTFSQATNLVIVAQVNTQGDTVLSIPTAPTNLFFQVQSSPIVGPGAIWQKVAGIYGTNGFIATPVANTNVFYRMQVR